MAKAFDNKLKQDVGILRKPWVKFMSRRIIYKFTIIK